MSLDGRRLYRRQALLEPKRLRKVYMSVCLYTVPTLMHICFECLICLSLHVLNVCMYICFIRLHVLMFTHVLKLIY